MCEVTAMRKVKSEDLITWFKHASITAALACAPECG